MNRLFCFYLFGIEEWGLADVLLHHLLEVGHDLGLLQRHAVEGFVELVGVEGVVDGIGAVFGALEMEQEADFRVCGDGEHHRAGQVAHRRTVEVGKPEDGGHRRAHANFALDLHRASGHLGILLQQRQPQSHLARGSRREERVGDLLHGFRTHAATVVLEDQRQRVCIVVLQDFEGDIVGFCTGGILENVHDVHRQVLHG